MRSRKVDEVEVETAKKQCYVAANSLASSHYADRPESCDRVLSIPQKAVRNFQSTMQLLQGQDYSFHVLDTESLTIQVKPSLNSPLYCCSLYKSVARVWFANSL